MKVFLASASVLLLAFHPALAQDGVKGNYSYRKPPQISPESQNPPSAETGILEGAQPKTVPTETTDDSSTTPVTAEKDTSQESSSQESDPVKPKKSNDITEQMTPENGYRTYEFDVESGPLVLE